MTEFDALENAIVNNKREDIIEWLLDFEHWVHKDGEFVIEEEVEKYLDSTL